jgi:predicted small lipoprotein YifL
MRRSRSPASIPHIMRPAVSLLLAAVLLSACGYKGPLYMPKPKPEAQRPAQPPDMTKEATPSQ